MTTAAVCTELSGGGAIEVQDWEVPPLGPGAVRIAVRAASVNFPAFSWFAACTKLGPSRRSSPALKARG